MLTVGTGGWGGGEVIGPVTVVTVLYQNWSYDWNEPFILIP